MTDITHPFLSESRRFLTADYLPKIERSLADLSDEEIWWRPNEASNSIGNLVLHLCGNVRQWIVGGIGGRQEPRDRQSEFDRRDPIERDELLARLRTVLAEADDVLGRVTAEELARRRHIQEYDVTGLEAIYHVVEHFSMHTGQIIYISKLRGGRDLGLWS